MLQLQEDRAWQEKAIQMFQIPPSRGAECQKAYWNCIPVMLTEFPSKGRGLVAARDIKIWSLKLNPEVLRFLWFKSIKLTEPRLATFRSAPSVNPCLASQNHRMLSSLQDGQNIGSMTQRRIHLTQLVNVMYHLLRWHSRIRRRILCVGYERIFISLKLNFLKTKWKKLAEDWRAGVSGARTNGGEISPV